MLIFAFPWLKDVQRMLFFALVPESLRYVVCTAGHAVRRILQQ